jgi:hypothetical protein
MFFLFLLLAVQAQPLCPYVCSTVVCNASCVPNCERPNCQAWCSNGEEGQLCFPPACYIQCQEVDPYLVNTSSCPLCSVQCSPLQCSLPLPTGVTCEIQCAPPSCNWLCSKPTQEECPKPECEMMCELPGVCGTTTSTASMMQVCFLLLGIIFLLF